MQSFVVLGIIPGTHIQITFLGWLYAMAALFGLVGLIRLFGQRHAIRAYLTSRRIARLIDHYQLLA